MTNLHEIAKQMITQIISDNMPYKSVENALKNYDFQGRKIYIVAIGKAAWTMTKAASDFLGDKIEKGIVITKYGHSQGEITRMAIYEAGHPILDENTISATEAALTLVENLGEGDTVLFLVSGGGSALFESPQEGVNLADLANLTNNLLASGADITEINMVRKRLSKVKAGRFAQTCSPANVFAIVLSDVLGDRLDSIASGPAAPDQSTSADALRIVEKYNLKLSHYQLKLLRQETPKSIDNVKTEITGSVRSLCESAAACAKSMGFTPYILTASLNCEAAEAGRFLGAIARDTQKGLSHFRKPCAIILGGETVVHIKGNGKGGRNQELALSAAMGISGFENTVIFSLGSDGTDGPTDAAGGLVDGNTVSKLTSKGLSIDQILANNDSYNGLKAVDGLIITGPTGTNVNDVMVALCL
ncbi:MAG: glycerate kinase [Defluviitaleaceae bacterium]|nr:glycerate kinase [Defluviitaleaceae bacterium]